MKSGRRFLLIGLFLLLCSTDVKAQSDTSAVDSSNGNSFLPVPVVFYLPETRWGFGATGVYNFRFKGEARDSRSCQLAPGFAYTLEKQLLLYTPFTLFWNDHQNYSYGELGYYKYFYFFHGIGNDQPESQEELYTVDFPRIQLNWLKKVKPGGQTGLYVGGQYWFENYAVKEREEGGQLAADTITGSGGGFTSGLGAVAVYDTRDEQFFPSTGWFAEAMINHNNPAIGSDFNYTRYRVNASRYLTLRWNHIVALNAYADMVAGDPPFHQLGFLGGPKRLRGFYEGRYRDQNAVVLQAEYRLPLFWRLKATVFGGVGSVAATPNGFVNDLHVRSSYGAGLRLLLNKEENVHVRFDAGFAANSSGFYITIGEAF